MARERVRERYVEALVAGCAPGHEVAGHVESCVGCREAIRGLSATWSLLETLPALEPRAEVAVRLRRRLRWGRARETIVSLERWPQVGLAGVLGVVLSVLLGLAVPYQTLVALCGRLWCRRFCRRQPPTWWWGMVYGLMPMAAGAALLGPRAARRGRACRGLAGLPRGARVVRAPSLQRVSAAPPRGFCRRDHARCSGRRHRRDMAPTLRVSV